jgi:hypothetical protein
MTKRDIIIYVLIAIGAGSIGMTLGIRYGQQSQFDRNFLRYQLYGDIYRSALGRLLTDPEKQRHADRFYSAVTGSVVDIRSIALGLDYYLSESNRDPSQILRELQAELRGEDRARRDQAVNHGLVRTGDARTARSPAQP